MSIRSINKVFFCCLILVLLVEIMMVTMGRLLFEEGNWGVLLILMLSLLLPNKQSKIILLIISLYGVISINWGGLKVAVPTSMEFTSGISLNMRKSIGRFIIGVFPTYFYLIQIGLAMAFFIRRGRYPFWS